MKVVRKKKKEVMYFAVVKSKNHMQHHMAVFYGECPIKHFFEWLVECRDESEKEFGEDALIVNCKRI